MRNRLLPTGRAAGGVLVVAAVLAMLAGCGKTVTGMASAAGDKPSGNLSGRLSKMNDAVDYHMIAKKSAHTTTVMHLGGQTVHGNADYEFHQDGLNMRYTMSGFGVRLGKLADMMGNHGGAGKNADTEIRVIDNVMYMKIPILATDKPWIKIDPNGHGALSKSIVPIVKMIQQSNDPTKLLDIATKAGKITKTTREKVDGQQTTHYSIRIDTQKMLNRVPDSPFQQLAKLGAARLPRSYPVDMWVNDNKLPVRMVIHPPLPGGMAQTMRTDFTAWGKPVVIEKPPADKIGKLALPSLPGMPSMPPGTSHQPSSSPSTN